MARESEMFKGIKAGLEDDLAYARGDKSRGRERLIRVDEPNVKNVRGKLGLSQEEFAAAFGVPLGTLRHWEQGLRRPEGAARVLLNVIDARPDVVAQVLNRTQSRQPRRRRGHTSAKSKLRRSA
jgi:putative transcriptional regulator